MNMVWDVKLTKKMAKQIKKLPEEIRMRLHFLVQEIKQYGPKRTNRPNYGKIRGAEDCHHCHIKKGKPTYVAVWKVTSEKTVEVTYAGTHEGADYERLC